MGNASSSDLTAGVSALLGSALSENEEEAEQILVKVITTSPQRLEDVIAALPPDHIRKMMQARPRNLARLILFAIDIINAVTLAPDIASYDRMMNAVRLLTRVLPIVFEDEAWTRSLFVDSKMPAWAGADESPTAAAPVGDAAWAARPGRAPCDALHSLCSGAMGALFLPDLTVSKGQYELFLEKLKKAEASAMAADETARAGGPVDTVPNSDDAETNENSGAAVLPAGVTPTVANAVWPMLLWKGGVTFPLLSTPTNAAWTRARTEVMRLILALMCGTLYNAPVPDSPTVTPFADFLTSTECDFAPTLFYCLLNTVVAYDPVGYGVPYANALVSDQDAPSSAIALQLLAVLLDYAPKASNTEEEGEAAVAPLATGEPSLSQFNMYRSMLAGLSEVDDFDCIFSALARQISSVPSSEKAILPGAYSIFATYPETLVLLWKLLDENKAFHAFVLKECDVSSLVTVLLYFLWTGRNNVTKVGMAHICTFILLLLSGERSFGVSLNRPFPPSSRPAFGSELPLFDGTYADLLLITLHKLVVDGSAKLAGLYSCFLTIIANVSPYSKGLSLPAAVKLVNMLELFAAPRFLFSRPSNYAFAQQLLEAINNIVQYQYESNGVLVYTLVRRKEVFQRLAVLTPETWLQELAAKAARKTELAAKSVTAAGATAAGTGLDAPDEGAASTEAEAEEGEGTTRDSEVVSRLSHVAGGEGGAVVRVTGEGSASAAATASVSAAAVVQAWMATDAWWFDARHALPLDTVLRLIAFLTPSLEDFVARAEGAVDEDGIIEHIADTTLVGILPVPHPILMRRYAPNQYTALWYTTFLWSTIFLHAGKDLPLWDATLVKLFSITVV